jgi:hypothetical protein
MATAESIIGIDVLWPRMVVVMSTSLTFTITRGLPLLVGGLQYPFVGWWFAISRFTLQSTGR